MGDAWSSFFIFTLCDWNYWQTGREVWPSPKSLEGEEVSVNEIVLTLLRHLLGLIRFETWVGPVWRILNIYEGQARDGYSPYLSDLVNNHVLSTKGYIGRILNELTA